ncbi:MAG: tetratricopeptide repeat protein [Deltaproteobacteria bacterium]
MRTSAPLAAALLLLASAGAGCAHGASARDKDTAIVHADIGAESVAAGRAQDALRSYDESLRYDPDLAEAHLGRGVVLELGFGKVDEAEAEYRKAIQLKPTFAEAHNNLGQLLARTGRLEEAVKEFDAATAIMLYREPWVARCNKGQALWQMGKKAEGIAEQKECLNFAPKYCQGWRELGRIQLLDGQTKDAVTSFEAYARACDKSADAQQLLGSALLRGGQRAKAREAFQRCAELGDGTAIGTDCRKSSESLR